MDSPRLEDAILTNQGAAAGETRPTAPSLDLSPQLAAKAWAKHLGSRRKEQKQVAVVIDLPSGQTIAVHRMPIWYMLHMGIVPDRLTAYAQNHVRLLSSGDAELAQKQTITNYLVDENNERVNWDDLLDTIWVRCVVLPKFGYPEEANVYLDDQGELRAVDDVELPAEPIFSVKDVDLIDKVFVYQFCQGVDESVEQFLRTTSAALGAVADVTGLPLSPE